MVFLYASPEHTFSQNLTSLDPKQVNDPSPISLLLEQAHELFEKGDYTNAFSKALEIRKESTLTGFTKGIAESWVLTGQISIRSAKYDTALFHFKEALQLYQNVNDNVGISSTHLYIGQAFDYLGKYKDALSQLQLALDMYTSISDTIIYVKIKNSLGVANFNLGNYEAALKLYVEALHLLNDKVDVKSRKHFAGLLNNIGVVYQQLHQYELAIEYFEQLLTTSKLIQNKYLVSVSLLNLGEVHKLKNNYTQSIFYLTEALNHYQSSDDSRGVALVYSNLGDVHKQLQNYYEATQSYIKSKKYGELTKNNDLIIRSMLGLSDLYILTGVFDKSKLLLKEALTIANEIDSKPSLEQVYLIQSRLDSAQGNYKSAYYWHKKHAKLRDSLLNDHNSKQIIQMRELYENERKEKEIIRLNEAREIEAIKNKSDKNLLKSVIAVAIIIIIFLVSSAYLKSRHATQLKDERDKVTKMNVELNELVKKINRQKRKLATKNEKLEDLYRENSGLTSVVAHDLRSPLNSISGITNLFPLVGTINSDQENLLKQISKLCDNGSNLISDLLELSRYEYGSEVNYIHFSLSMFIQGLLENYTNQLSKKNLTLITSFKSEELPFITTDQSHLNRILDNLLSNAIKFSQSGKSIHFIIKQTNPNSVSFIIQDEGPGFESADLPHLFKKFKKLSARPTGGENSTGLGLSIVKALADKIQGSVNVENATPAGARITVTIPISVANPVKSEKVFSTT
jgi:signal transduction histidine kinase